MHGCDVDIPLLAVFFCMIILKTDYNIYVNNLFDTGRAFAFLDLKSTEEGISKKCMSSLEKIITNLLEVKIDKFFQLADWRIRPLPKAMLSYARTDSHYLIYLYKILCEKLNEEEKNEDKKKEKRNKLVELCIECNNLLKRRFEKIKYKRIKLITKYQN